jgi:two-component system response regulator AlgR
MKVLIADDEPLARARLSQLLAEIDGTIELVGEAANGLEALRLALASHPDTVLLDIRMPVLNGIECARELARLPTPPAVVFVTAYDDYALEAFDVAACDYVMKPARPERLRASLEKARRFGPSQWDRLKEGLRSRQQPRERLCAYNHGEIRLIPVEEVLCFQSEQKYTRVRLLAGDVLIDDPLKLLEDEFGDRFVRIHRNTLVAVAKVDRMEKLASGVSVVVLLGLAEPLEISRRCLSDVRGRLRQS